MTLLGREDLLQALDADNVNERLFVTPLLDRDEQVGAGSIDLRLDTRFILLRRSLAAGIDPEQDDESAIELTREHLTVPFGEGLWLHPDELVLGATLEWLRVPPTLGAYVLSRSTWARSGLTVAVAVMVHPGFVGSLTLELKNMGTSPLKLYPGLRVAQLAVHRLEQPMDDAFLEKRRSQYTHAPGPRGAGCPWTKDEMRRLKGVGARWTGVQGDDGLV